MIVERKNLFGIKKIVSYCDSAPLQEGDIVQYNYAYQRFDGLTISQTLLTDLTDAEEVLFAKISPKTKNEIRRAEKEQMQTRMYGLKDISDETIRCFAEAYIQFRIRKELSCPRLDEMVTIYESVRKSGKLMLSEAIWNGESVARHIYYVSNADYVAILRQSFSLYREDGANRQRIGNANRFLHWEDMKKLKGMGIRTLDWGGYNMNNDEVVNISKFKIEFAGVVTDVYGGEIYRTFKGKLVAIPLHLKRWLTRRL